MFLFSDDEDCASGDESELLQERARLASRRTGGCLYFSPPGGGEGFPTVATREERKRPFFETTTAGIVLEGMAEMPEGDGDGHGENGRGESAAAAAAAAVSAGLGETTEVEEGDEEAGGRTGSRREKSGHGHRTGGRAPREGWENRGFGTGRDDGELSEERDSSPRANKRRPRGQWEGEVNERGHGGAARGVSGSGGGGGSSRRHGRFDIDIEVSG